MSDLETSPEFLDTEPPHWAARGLSWVIIGLFLFGLLAAILVEVPETVSGRFRLAPVTGADPVKARKDGILIEVRVGEGDTVNAGEPLLTLRSASMSDRFGDQRTFQTQARADEERLRIAEIQYQTRRRAEAAEARRLRSRTQSLTRLIESKRRRLALMKELADSAQSGYRSGAINRVEAARLDLEVTTLTEEVQIASNDLEDVEADLARLARDGEAREVEYQGVRRSLQESMETARVRIEALGRDLTDLTDSGLVVYAPCKGVVLRLYVSAPGAVIREGETISEVACAGQKLQAEFLVAQAGLPLIRAGQAVTLRYDAFPYQRYGVRFGQVRWVGQSGAAARDSGAFRVVIDLADDSVRVQGQGRALMAGMEGRADVVVGRRSLVSYAVEPIRALRENLREVPQ